jgi:hypothetical protein
MMPDLGDITVGPGDVTAQRATVTNINGEAPAALLGASPAEGPVWVSDASHACGLDDLNAVVGQQIKITLDHGAQGRPAVHDNQPYGLLTIFNGGVTGSGLLLLEGFSRCRPEPG